VRREFAPTAPSRGARIGAVALLALVLCAVGPAVLLLGLPVQVAYAVGPGVVVGHTRHGPFARADRWTLPSPASASLRELQGGRRVSGTAMPGLCAGRWAWPGVGEVEQLGTCGAAMVLVPRAGELPPLLLEPADRAAFAAAVRSGAAGRFPAAVPDPASAWWRLLPGALGLAPLLLLGLVLGGRRLRYRVDGAALVVELPWSRRRLSLPGALVHPAHRPRRVWRLFGTSLPGLHLGWFRAEGRALRVHATTLREGVLVELPGGDRTFLSPADPEAFAAALVAAGARRAGPLSGG
jgi:hypothetical protein